MLKMTSQWQIAVSVKNDVPTYIKSYYQVESAHKYSLKVTVLTIAVISALDLLEALEWLRVETLAPMVLPYLSRYALNQTPFS